ncbi:MAG TPA: hypothetical protein PLH72_17490 [Vicinamibacterales bacterium]|nr:hypothetical protein [Vicinamibacterales bacterium]
MNHQAAVRILDELIAAIDRRRPQEQRGGEAAIARDAAVLKAQAQKRIAELQHEPALTEPA